MRIFFSRDTACLKVPDRLLAQLQHVSRKNVVSHCTYSSPKLFRRDALYGVRTRPEILPSEKLGSHSISKFGSASCHYRINTHPSQNNYGKFLVFKSSNIIRAGKHTHAMAMRNTILFSRWARAACGQRNVWHTAMSAPNMVVSGALKGALPEHVKDHWSTTHSSKFPGIAISTSGSCTPEVYKSGAFIIPGISTVQSLQIALNAMDCAIHDEAPRIKHPPPPAPLPK